jgi:DNA-binding XRE family transcriptional regulator
LTRVGRSGKLRKPAEWRVKISFKEESAVGRWRRHPMKKTQSDIARILRKMRMDMELTQEEMAALLDISKNYLALCEAGLKQMSIPLLIDFVKAYKKLKGDNPVAVAVAEELKKLYKEHRSLQVAEDVEKEFDEICFAHECNVL